MSAQFQSISLQMPSMLTRTGVNRIVSKKASPIGVTGAQLEVLWELGGFSNMKTGDSITTTIATGPKGLPQDWKLAFYPRGFVNPSSSSFFVTNLACLEDRPLPPDTELTATVCVAVAERDAGGGVGGGGRKHRPSETQGGSGKDLGGSGGGLSSSSASSSKASTAGGAGRPPQPGPRAGNGGPQASTGLSALGVCRKLSKTFTAKGHTFGFENFADRDVLFGKGSAFIHADGADGILRLHVSINVTAGPQLAPPEVDETLRDSGWQRVRWLLRDIKVHPVYLLY